MSTEYANLGFRVDSSGLLPADQRLKNVTNSGRATEAQITTLNKTFSGLTSTLGLATTALGLIGAGMSVRGVIDYSDAWSNVNSQLRQVTNSEQDLISTRSQLLKITKETRSELTNTVDLYATMTRSTKDLNISSERLMGVTKTLNNLFVSGGKPISEVEGAIRQLNQGLAAGALRGDEFNSVAEGAPKVMDALAAKLQMTRGELRNFAATGGITSEILISALEDYQVTAQKLADQTAKTFGQNLQNATTNVTEFVGNSESLNSAVGSLGNGIESLSENLDALAESGESVLYLMGGAAALMGGKYVSGVVAAEAALIKHTMSQAASAKQTLINTQAEVNLLKVQQQGYANTILRVKSEVMRDTIRKQLTATTTTLATAEARLTAAQTAEAAAASRATVANIALNRSRTAGAALASAAMGPWGLLAAAIGVGAIAFVNAREESDKLNKSLSEQKVEVSRLEKMYSAMASGALGKTYVELQSKAIEIDSKRAAAIAEIARLEVEREKATKGLYGRSQAAAAKDYTDAIIAQREEIKSLDKQSNTLGDRIDIVNKVFEEGLPTLTQTTSAVSESTRVNAKAAQSYADIVKSLENQRQQLILTSDEFEVYMVMQQASANQWTPAMTAQIIKQTKALQDQRAAIETTNAQLDNLMGGDLFGFGGDDSAQELSSDLDSLIDQVDNFGGAWTRTGNVIADSMGGAVSILDDFASKMQSIEKLQADLTNERKEYADGTKEAIKIDESLAKLQQESASAQIGAIGQTIGLSSQLFKENSKERKALHALEMGFMAVEIAMAAEKAVVNAVNAVATQGQGDPYTAFGRIASMIGIMGGVLAAAGIAFSGGSGGGGYEAPTGGAGTVLGDSSSQSSSIRNASERLEDIQTDQLSELMAIRQSMSQLNSGIQNLAKSFITGLDFNSASSPLQNSNFLDAKGGSLLRDISPLARAADFVDKLTGGVLGLGGVVDKIFGGFSGKKQKLIDSGITFVSQTMQDVFDSGQLDADMFQVIETTKKKFWGLSKSKSTKTETSGIGGAITSQMGDIFGFIGDTVVGAAESLGLDAKHIITTGLETLPLGDALNNFVIDIGNVSFADKTGEEIQKELESIFSQQADLMSEYLVPSIKEYQQIGEGAFETLQRVAYEQAVFNDALERTGLNLAGLSSVMQIDVAQSIITLTGGLERFSELSNSFFESFFSESEQLAYLEKSLTEAFGGLGLSMIDSREGFKDLLTGIDITTEAGQGLYASLLQLVPSMDSYLSALEKEEEERKQARIGFLEDEKSLINSSINSLSSLISNINNELGQAYTVQEALAAARRGDFDIAKKMTGQRIMASDFADSISFARAKAIEENRLFEISSLASAEKSDLERQVELLDKQIEVIQNGADDQVSAILDLGEIVNNGNNDIIRAIMTPSSNNGANNLMSDIPGTSNSISKSLEESKQQAANAMQQVEIMNREVVKNTKTTAKILQKIELNGVRVLQ